jgi:DNA-binding HxlR family transcriptional regulator
MGEAATHGGDHEADHEGSAGGLGPAHAPLPDERHEQACSIARALEVMGDRWTILVLRDAFRGIRRFEDFRRDLDIARPVLADRLKRLVGHGVLEKRLYQERPRRYEYRLTPMGRELSPILVALMRWGDHHLAGEAGPPTVLTHECGHELSQGFYCPACRQVFAPSEIRSRPGPGARATATTEGGTVADHDPGVHHTHAVGTAPVPPLTSRI